MKTRNQVATICILLACSYWALALDPSLDVNQYAHTTWKVGEGVLKGGIWSIAQTPDGYLWLGTEFGLLRFDGVRAIPWQAPAGEHLPSSDIRSVRVGRDGALWIGTYRGLARWDGSKLTHYPELDGLIVEALLEDHGGTLWAVAGWTLSEARLCRIQGGKTRCYGENGGPGARLTSIYEDSKGNLWAGAMNGVWRWQPDGPKFYPMAGPAQRTYALIESDDGGILVARRGGITKLSNGRFEPYPFPAGLQFPPDRLLRDRDGGLWIGALVDQGLLHIHRGKADVFTPDYGASGDLSGDNVRCLFEDREGNVWVATNNGLDRFREFAVPTYSVQQGLSSRGVSSVLAAKDGTLWLGTADGLNKFNNGQITIYRKPILHRAGLARTPGGPSPQQAAEPGTSIRVISATGLPEKELMSLYQDDDGNLWVATAGGTALLNNERFIPVGAVPPGNVLSITGDHAGNVWMSHEEGLFHLHRALLVDRIPWASLGHKEPANALLHDAARGGLWIGFHDGGVVFFKDGELRASYGGAQGLAEGMVHSLYSDREGVLWVTTAGGVSGIKDGRVLTLTTQSGLPCNNVHWMMEDNVHAVWLYMACGLGRIEHLDLDAWLSHAKQNVQVSVFDAADGVKTHPSISGYNPIVAKASNVKLWFTTSDDVSVIDPQRLGRNKLPPPVHIEQITADEKTYDVSNGVRLHPRVRNLAIDYTALSLVTPEKMRFRYKLEGQNNNWHEVVNDRKVQYTNLGPGTYHFRVLACNNSGVWNEEGASLDFVIPPMWYETNWFYTLCVAVFMAVLWAAYQLRVRQLAAQFNMRLEERVAERTRIARDLHDTLLQSFQALLPRLQASINMFSSRPDDARRNLEQAVDRASHAIAEGRDAIQGMRMSTVEKNDLAVAIRTLGEELASAATKPSSPNFTVVVEGTSRNLHPILRDEVYRLATEALRNAFRHAAAQNVEVEIRYDEKYFRLRVRDDGKGIPSDVLSGDGPEGHYGLPGMRERAKLVDGKLTIWTEVDGGTEIELNIPGARAFVKSTRPFWYFGKRSAAETDEKEPIERE